METRFKKELESFKKLGFLNHLNLTKEEGELLPVKYNARAVVLLNNNKILIIRAENGAYHSIVGGGVEDNEGIENALSREVKEESGYDISIINPIGYLEYWTKKYKKIDFCFLVKVVGTSSPLNLTKEELSFGHEIMEYSISDAISVLENDGKDPNKVVSIRSLIELKESQKYLKNMVK